MEYIGSNLTHFDYESLTLEFISKKDRADEPCLFDRKFWDYKPLHPMQATYLFAHHYKNAIKSAIMRRTDLYKGLSYKGLKKEDFLECSKRVINGLWRGRQHADAFGVPYDIWCNSAMKYAESRDWQYLPNPTQIYSKKTSSEKDIDMVSAIVSRWDEVKSSQFIGATHPFFQAENYCGNPYQRAYQAAILKHLRSTQVKGAFIATYGLEKKQLMVDLLTKEYGDERAKQLMRLAKYFLVD